MTGLLNISSSDLLKSVQQLAKLSFRPGIGTIPDRRTKDHFMPKISKDGIFLKLLQPLPADYAKVKHFDLIADEYQLATHQFKSCFLDRVFEIIQSQIFADSYILEVSCGPGYEAMQLSRFVPEGEVIALDLSSEMIKLAFRNAKLKKISNMAFFQADVHRIPAILARHFDLTFCNLSMHFYKDVAKVLRQFHRTLQKGGKVIIVEPTASTDQLLQTSIVKNALPQFQRFYSIAELKALLQQAGFRVSYWEEIQKNIGLTIAIKV